MDFSLGRVMAGKTGRNNWRSPISLSMAWKRSIPLTAFAVGGFDFVGGGLGLANDRMEAFIWEDVTPDSEGFRDVFFIDASTGWIVGSSIL